MPHTWDWFRITPALHLHTPIKATFTHHTSAKSWFAPVIISERLYPDSDFLVLDFGLFDSPVIVICLAWTRTVYGLRLLLPALISACSLDYPVVLSTLLCLPRLDPACTTLFNKAANGFLCSLWFIDKYMFSCNKADCNVSFNFKKPSEIFFFLKF